MGGRRGKKRAGREDQLLLLLPSRQEIRKGGKADTQLKRMRHNNKTANKSNDGAEENNNIMGRRRGEHNKVAGVSRWGHRRYML